MAGCRRFSQHYLTRIQYKWNLHFHPVSSTQQPYKLQSRPHRDIPLCLVRDEDPMPIIPMHTLLFFDRARFKETELRGQDKYG
jgi:hypothetical protein